MKPIEAVEENFQNQMKDFHNRGIFTTEGKVDHAQWINLFRQFPVNLRRVVTLVFPNHNQYILVKNQMKHQLECWQGGLAFTEMLNISLAIKICQKNSPNLGNTACLWPEAN